MIKVIDIIKRKGRIYTIEFSNKVSFDISETSLSHHHLFRGKELSTDEFNAVKKGAQTDVAYVKGLAYLSKQMRTKDEVRTHLKKQMFTPVTIETALELLAKEGHIDDIRYATMVVEDKMHYSIHGPKKIIRYLQQKGIDKPTIQKALIHYDESLQIITITKDLEKQTTYPINKPFYKAIQSLKQRYFRNGFASHVIDQVFQDHHDMIEQAIDETTPFERDLKALQTKEQSLYVLQQKLRKKGYSSAIISTIKQ